MSTRRWRSAEGIGRAVSGMRGRGRRGVHEAMEDCGWKRAGGQQDEGEEGRPRGDEGLRREEGGRSAG